MSKYIYLNFFEEGVGKQQQQQQQHYVITSAIASVLVITKHIILKTLKLKNKLRLENPESRNLKRSNKAIYSICK